MVLWCIMTYLHMEHLLRVTGNGRDASLYGMWQMEHVGQDDSTVTVVGLSLIILKNRQQFLLH